MLGPLQVRQWHRSPVWFTRRTFAPQEVGWIWLAVVFSQQCCAGKGVQVLELSVEELVFPNLPGDGVAGVVAGSPAAPG